MEVDKFIIPDDSALEDSTEIEQKNMGTQMTFIGDEEVDDIIEPEIELSEMKEQVILTVSDDIDDETNGNDENDDKVIVTVIDPEDIV